MKGTKLWQAAGSPIIQGQSRRQRPAWQQWLPAWAAVSAGAVALLYAFPEPSGGSRWEIPLVLLGGLLGAFTGVRLSRSMGWRFPLLWGVILGALGAVVLYAAGGAVLPA